MNLNEYQQEAKRTAYSQNSADAKMVALLGLAGETGELLSEYKKHLRDGDAHRLFPHRVREELGDLLWYIAQVANLFDIPLDQVAEANLIKTRDRWGLADDSAATLPAVAAFDETFGESERLPQTIEARMEETWEGGRLKMRMFIGNDQTGDDITDNSYNGDGYRFHDVFHLANAMVLGWSPVMRQLLGRKRKSKPETDEVEDGGRAKAIEEGISAMVFAYAKDHNFLEGIGRVDRDTLLTIKKMTGEFEVGERTPRDWESAILQGFAVWRQMEKNGGGTVLGDFTKRTLSYAPLST